MFKKIFSLIFILLAMTVVSVAQSAKPRIYINNFEVAQGVTEANANTIYQAILSAVNDTKRFEVAIEGMESALSREIARRSSEAAMHDAATRNDVLVAAGCQYLMTGQIHKCDVSQKYDDEGKRYYSCILGYAINVAEVATSTTVASQSFDNTGSNSLLGSIVGGMADTGSTPEDAINNAVQSINRDVMKFIVDNFPIEGLLIPSDYEVKKDKLVSCYIDLGTQQGVKVGDTFSVMAPKVVLGNVTYNEIGKIRVNEVVAASISQCKVTAGAKDIYQAIENYMSLDEASQETQKIKVVAVMAASIL